MRGLGGLGFCLVLFLGGYVFIVYFFLDKRETFTEERIIGYPVEKVFPQFNNFQNFVSWNDYFTSEKKIKILYFTPYQGEGGAINFENRKKTKMGQMFIQSETPNKQIDYVLFMNEDQNPFEINVKFIPLSERDTKIVWQVNSPKKSFLESLFPFLLLQKIDLERDLDLDSNNLEKLLAKKVDRDEQLKNIVYDSIMVEHYKGDLLLGLNVVSSNKNGELYKNIIKSHSSISGFVTGDLNKKEDEYGLPMLVTNPENYLDNEVSYFFGIPVTQNEQIADYRYSYLRLDAKKAYSVYYTGPYKKRINLQNKLIKKALKDSLSYDKILQVFIRPPEEKENCVIKMILPLS
ncbi:MAG: polyketide cyclase [Bergeyella sp.]|nr:polyketide cyclase [Bergeyella sp.]